MSLHTVRPCPCGSGEPSSWLTDARGIPLRRTCGKCHEQVIGKYRDDIFHNPEYDLYDDRLEEDGSPW